MTYRDTADPRAGSGCCAHARLLGLDDDDTLGLQLGRAVNLTNQTISSITANY